MSLIADQRQHLKSVLLQQLKAAQQQLLEAEANHNIVELDQTRNGRLTRMDAMQQQAMAEALIQNLKHKIQTLQSGLARIDSEDYGYCYECDEAINPQRLEITPDTKYCIHCAP